MPALTLSFLVTGIPQDAQIQESDDEVLTLGKLELGFLKENKSLNIYSLGIIRPWNRVDGTLRMHRRSARHLGSHLNPTTGSPTHPQ